MGPPGVFGLVLTGLEKAPATDGFKKQQRGTDLCIIVIISCIQPVSFIHGKLTVPAGTWHGSGVIVASGPRRFDVKTTLRRRFGVMVALLLRRVSAGLMGINPIKPLNLLCIQLNVFSWIKFFESFESSSTKRTLVSNNRFDHWDVVGASTVGTAPITSPFSN